MSYSLESTPLQPETRSCIAEGYIWLDWFVTRLGAVAGAFQGLRGPILGPRDAESDPKRWKNHGKAMENR